LLIQTALGQKPKKDTKKLTKSKSIEDLAHFKPFNAREIEFEIIGNATV